MMPRTPPDGVAAPIPASAAGGDDLWYVAMAPDEIKALTLEKLDDLYRLSVIDISTKIWQPGMSEWLPLGVVAGIDADGPVSARPQAAPPRGEDDERTATAAAAERTLPAAQYPRPSAAEADTRSEPLAPAGRAAPASARPSRKPRRSSPHRAPAPPSRLMRAGELLVVATATLGLAMALSESSLFNDSRSAHHDATYSESAGAPSDTR